MSPPLKAAILVVSTSAFEGCSTDSTSDTLRHVFESTGKWTVTDVEIVSDDAEEIQRTAEYWADQKDTQKIPDLIVTTGGTGFSETDVTPEAIEAILDKKAPGLVHAMMSASLSKTPFAMMSRPVAGIYNHTIIITLPGSPKGARENLEAVIHTLPHACAQIAGANSRALHEGGVEKLEAEANITPSSRAVLPESRELTAVTSASGSSHHQHGCAHQAPVQYTSTVSDQVQSAPRSNNPAEPATRRHRTSPYPMISVDDALAIVREHAHPKGHERVRVDHHLIGAVIAEPVIAAEDVPAFRASIVDGYAVAMPANGSGDLRGEYRVVAVVHAAASTDAMEGQLPQGQAVRITTGAPLPHGTDCVIMVEDTKLVRSKRKQLQQNDCTLETVAASAEKQQGSKNRVEIKEEEEEEEEEEVIFIEATGVKRGSNVREPGSDVRAGTVVMQPGDVIRPLGGELGLLISIGVNEVVVHRRPKLAVMSTGNELVDNGPDKIVPLSYGQVRDVNRRMLLAAAISAGFSTVDMGIVNDTSDKLAASIKAAQLGFVDILVTTGGVSMGELDLMKPVIEHNLGGSILFGRVAMKPGKPTTFATIPPPTSSKQSQNQGLLVFALPGNPASALVTFNLFVLPCLHQMAGGPPVGKGTTRIPVLLGHDFPLDPQRTEYHRAVVSIEKADKDSNTASLRLVATSTGQQRSSTIGSLKTANAFLELPPANSNQITLKRGTVVEALLIDKL